MRLFAILSALLATSALALPNSHTAISRDLTLPSSDNSNNITLNQNPNQTLPSPPTLLFNTTTVYINPNNNTDNHPIPDPFCQYSYEGLSYHLHAGSSIPLKLSAKELKTEVWKCKMHHMTKIKYGKEAPKGWKWELKTHASLEGMGCVIQVLSRALEMDMWPKCPIVYDP